VCSDGLNSMVSDRDIGAIVSRLDFSAKQICDQLINAANQAGGTDNITVITADFDVNNNNQILAQAPIKDFQESTAATTTKTMRNIFLGVLGGLAIALGWWFAFIRVPPPDPKIAELEKRKQDSLTAIHIADSISIRRAEERQDRAADRAAEERDKNSNDRANQKKIEQKTPIKTDPAPALITDNKLLDQTTNSPLIGRMRNLVKKRAEVGDFLKHFKEEDLGIDSANKKKKLNELRAEGTSILNSFHSAGILTTNDTVNLEFNKEKEDVVKNFETVINKFEIKVKEWCENTSASNCNFYSR
jgi:hypothetical protein